MYLVIFSPTSLLLLTAPFLLSIQNLNFGFCDSEHFRKVLRVEVDAPQRRRRQQEDAEVFGTFNETDDENLMRMVVDVECRDCDGQTTLFANSSMYASADLGVPLDLPNSPLFTLLAKRGRALQSNATSCLCASAFPSQERAPTTEEFLSVFNGTVLDLQVVGNLGEGKTVEEVIEVKSVPCSDTVSQFTSKIVVGLEGNPELLTKEETSALEVSFKDCTFHYKCTVVVVVVVVVVGW